MTEPATTETDQVLTGLDKILSFVPKILASHAHVIWLLALGIYLIVLPLCGVHVSPATELIGGNYTNVTSDIGACIAAGGTLHLVKHQRNGHNEMRTAINDLKSQVEALIRKGSS